MDTLCYSLWVKDTLLSVKDTLKLCTRAASLARFVCEIIHQKLRPFTKTRFFPHFKMKLDTILMTYKIRQSANL